MYCKTIQFLNPILKSTKITIMATQNETGFPVNVANFDELIAFVNGYGDDYKPTKESIKTNALLLVASHAKEALAAVNLALPPYTNAVAARETAFEPLDKLVTRIMNSLIATDATKPVVDSVKTLGRKLHGKRATPKKTDEEKKALLAEGKEVNENSSSQMGFDDKLENCDKLINLLASITLYDPNEADLKISALTEMYNDLKNKNASVIAAKVPLSRARILRDSIFNDDNTGLCDVAADVKAYVKSLYGATSRQYKQISKLKFTKIKS